MLKINADLHIHSRFSISTSKEMTFKTLAAEAPKKGVHLIGSGDCLHKKWFNELKELETIDEGTYELDGTRFIPTVELQGMKRTHHLILFPSLSSVEQFREKIQNISKNIDTDGRPHVPLTGEEIAEIALDVNALIGPCHAFTPWTGLYGYFSSLKECYGEHSNNISFLELGLSADSSYANKISELDELTLISNSDAHSPYPIRLAREFNKFLIEDITFAEIKKAILRQGGRKCILNVGLPPEEGKYNKSACSRCFEQYTLDMSEKLNWRCQICGGIIKKGVYDRVEELTTDKKPNNPKHRPKYIHLIPLTEIISKALDYKNVNGKNVQNNWLKLITEFNNEINVLLETEIEDIERITNKEIAWAIECFRNDKIILHPGGGGKYGQIEIPKPN